MNRIIKAAAFTAALWASAALGQSAPPTMGFHTVYGRLGATSGDTGPGQAIPFSVLLSNLTGTQSANTVYAGPTSGGVASPSFRALVGADLPVPGASSLGGIFSLTCSSSNWFNTLSTAGALGCSQPAFTDISGSIAATQLPNPSASTLGGVKSLASVSHNFLTSISTAGQPTQAQPACADVSDASVYCTATQGQLPGTITNDSASSGKIGEYVSSSIAAGSAVALTTATAANVTSISLTAGDWDVWIQPFLQFSGTTNITIGEASVSTTSATLNVTPIAFSQWVSPTTSGTVPGGVTNGFSLPPVRTRISIASTTTVYFVAQASFTVAACTAYGAIQARRIR